MCFLKQPSWMGLMMTINEQTPTLLIECVTTTTAILATFCDDDDDDVAKIHDVWN